MTTPTRSDAAAGAAAAAAAAAPPGTLAFHVFLGAHSLLIGLLPFYLPVWLWRNGLDLAGLSLLIGVSGLSFAAALAPWQRLASMHSRRRLISLTLLLEIVLVALVFAIGERGTAAAPVLTALLLGVANGAYGAFFWTTQRVLFAATLGANDAGRRYGNVQILVTVLLKLGIVIGGVVLEAGGLGWLLLLSLGIAALAGWQLVRLLPATPLIDPPPDRSTGLSTGPDRPAAPAGAPTRSVFLVDGVFLLLESHFWTLSLFLVFGEDFTRLGLLVVVLGAAFALLFWLVRSLVDRIAPTPFYRLAVGLYALSWLLRARLDDLGDGAQREVTLLALLIVITFCSSVFRLTFSKRFFELARRAGTVPYLVWKSRLSQTALGLAFLGMSLGLALGRGPALHALDATYAAAALLALVYLALPDPKVAGRGDNLEKIDQATEHECTATDHARSVRDP